MLVNVDPLNPVNTAEPGILKDAGFGGVRLVSRQGVEQFVESCHVRNLFVLACVTQQSRGYLVPGADCYQIGNEPDIAGTLDSMPAQAFADHLQLYRNTYPDLMMVTGGLARGVATFLRDVRDAGGLAGYSGVGLHYPAMAATFSAFTRYASGLPFVVSEWWTPADKVLAYRLMLRQQNVLLAGWFCWGYEQFALSPEQNRALNA